MRLPNREIPAEFVNALPEGIKYVNKQGRDFLIVEHICCPNGHKLNSDSVLINGEPAIRIKTKIGKSEGFIFIDSFWGGHDKLYNFVPDIASSGGVAEVCCPICGVSMIVEKACKTAGCGSHKHIVFTLPDLKNKIFVCAKLGCTEHQMEISEVPESVSNQVNAINYFGEQDVDIFEGI